MVLRHLTIFILLFPLTLLAQDHQSEKTITVEGKVQFLNPDNIERFNKVWLYRENGMGRVAIDSVKISPEGNWHFKIEEVQPTFYTVDIAKWDRSTFFSDSDVVINTRGYDTAKVKIKNPPYVFIEGSDANNFINLAENIVYLNYQKMIAAGKEMYYAGQSKDSAWIKYLKEQNPYDQVNKDYYSRIKVLIQAYKDKPVVIYGLRMLNWEKNQDFILPILRNLNAKYPWFTDAAAFQNEMEQKIAQAKALKPGNPIPQINYPDVKGTKHNLETYKGKKLLIDFWASWCGPCRAAIPKLKKLYANHKKDGLAILSISIDDSKDAWIKAMNDEKMPWQQLLSPDKNETMRKFLFSGIPTMYMVDEQGKIIGSFTGYTPEAEKKIESLFEGDDK